MLFRRIFELNADATGMFQFAEGYGAGDEEMYKNEAFIKHATGVVATVTAAVELLKAGDMDKLVAVLKDLGARHAKLNLAQAHFDLVGQSLLDTLEKALGAGFSPNVKAAWVGVYGVITEQMMAGAKEATS